MAEHESSKAPTDALAAESTPKPRLRRYRKRIKVNAVARPPIPVRALWEMATEEERRRAHETCTSMLELWLGRATKAAILERLQIPPLRLWQLSQQALSGMAAGLLVQPKTRAKGQLMVTTPDEDVKALKKRNAKLEQEVKDLELLVELLRELPGYRERAKELGIPKPEGGGPNAQAATFRSRKSTPPKTQRRRAKNRRRVAPSESNPETPPETLRKEHRGEPPHAPDLEGEGREAAGT